MDDDESKNREPWVNRDVLERLMVGETRAIYVAEPPDQPDDETPLYHHARTKLSSKNQITLPVTMVRALGLKPGDEIDLRLTAGSIDLRRRPQTPDEWAGRLYGALARVPEWKTKESIDTWIRNERDSWDREWDRDEPGSTS